MARPGPRPTPTTILSLRGSKRAAARAGEVCPDMTPPTCPAWLDREAKAEWRRLAPELSRLGLLTAVDGTCFAVYCQAVAEFRLAVETLQREGRTITVGGSAEKPGQLQPHPCVSMRNSAAQTIRQFAAMFGLSPADRVGLPAAPEEAGEDDGVERFLAGPPASGQPAPARS